MAGKDKRKGITVPMPFSLLLLPVILLAGLVSIPCTAVWKRIYRRRRRELETRMKAQRRTIGWAEFVKAFQANEGTLIDVRSSFKESCWWWTSDSVRGLSPFPVHDWLTMLEERAVDPFVFWCWERYTSPETGSAFLIIPSSEAPGQASAIWRKHHESEDNDDERWIDVAPPKNPRKARI